MAADADARIRQALPLVRRVALRLARRLPASVELDDLVQAGSLGLIDAARRFDLDQAGAGTQASAAFAVYALRRIRGAMIDQLRRDDALPRSDRRLQRTLELAQQRLEHRHLRPARGVEIAAEIGIGLTELRTLQARLDAARPGGEPDEPHDAECEATLDPMLRLQLRQRAQAALDAIERLPPRDRLVLEQLAGQEARTCDLAATLGVSAARICQIRTRAAAFVRRRLAVSGA